ncbi:MAG: hypothetical protein KJO45_07275 [Sulfurovum sp.]|nr:hypothetical protein [Sulfurovum sp.]
MSENLKLFYIIFEFIFYVGVSVNTSREDTIERMEQFYGMVEVNIENGMLYRDAIELAAVMIGGIITAKVSQAMAKYQEAIHPQSHLSQEENKDALALLSMGILWDNKYFNPVEPDDSTPLENTLAESIYFIMKYGREEDGLNKALEANEKNEGNVELRAEAIRRVLGKV